MVQFIVRVHQEMSDEHQCAGNVFKCISVDYLDLIQGTSPDLSCRIPVCRQR